MLRRAKVVGQMRNFETVHLSKGRIVRLLEKPKSVLVCGIVRTRHELLCHAFGFGGFFFLRISQASRDARKKGGSGRRHVGGNCSNLFFFCPFFSQSICFLLHRSFMHGGGDISAQVGLRSADTKTILVYTSRGVF